MQKQRAGMAGLLAILTGGIVAMGGAGVAAEDAGDGGQAETAASATAAADDSTDYVQKSIRGHVVWLADALKRRHDIRVANPARKNVLALETKEGRLVPLIEDQRGQSFRIDSRLREMDVELLVRRYETVPMLQVIRVYEWKDGKKYIVDYYCDVCAIVMFQSGACSCCQQDNYLRKRPVEEVAGH